MIIAVSILTLFAETLIWNPSVSPDVVAYHWIWNGTNAVTTFTNVALGPLREGSMHQFSVVAVSSSALESPAATLTYIKPVSTPPCSYDLSVLSQTFPYAGGNGSVEVNTASGCHWSVTGVPPWIVGQASGMLGSGRFSFSVKPNNGSKRTATIMVAGQPFLIVQQKRTGKPI